MSVWEKLGQCLDIFMVWEVSWPNPEEPWLHQSLWSSPRWPMWRERPEGADLVLKKDEEMGISLDLAMATENFRAPLEVHLGKGEEPWDLSLT